MTVLRTGRRLVGAAAIGGAALLAMIGESAAQSPGSVQSGWWDLTAVGPLAAVPSATPSNELQVSYGIRGPLAFAAVSYVLPSSAEPARDEVVLTLTIVPDSTVGSPSVAACPTTRAWSAGPDQPESKAPSYQCGAGELSSGTVASDGVSEAWTLTPNEQARGHPGLYQVALVPAPGSDLPFSVAFDQPTTTSLEVVPPATPVPAGPAPVVTQPAPAPSPNGAPAVTAPAPAVAVSSTTVPPAAVTPGVSMPGIESTAPAPGAFAGGTKDAPAVTAAAPHQAGSTSKRSLGVGILLVTGVALALSSDSRDRPPRLLGGFGAKRGDGGAVSNGPVGGIGRFARPRSGPANRI